MCSGSVWVCVCVCERECASVLVFKTSLSLSTSQIKCTSNLIFLIIMARSAKRAWSVIHFVTIIIIIFPQTIWPLPTSQPPSPRCVLNPVMCTLSACSYPLQGSHDRPHIWSLVTSSPHGCHLFSLLPWFISTRFSIISLGLRLYYTNLEPFQIAAAFLMACIIRSSRILSLTLWAV